MLVLLRKSFSLSACATNDNAYFYCTSYFYKLKEAFCVVKYAFSVLSVLSSVYYMCGCMLLSLCSFGVVSWCAMVLHVMS